MNIKNLKLSTVTLLIFGLSNLQAQEVIPATGGDASGSGGSASYTVGQVVYTTSVGTNGNSVSQGVQQPFEISIVTGIERQDINLRCVVYPNPTTSYLILSTNIASNIPHGRESEILIYQLFNIEGRMISTDKILSENTKIKMNNLPQGNYILRIVETMDKSSNNALHKQQTIKTFKIIKH